MSHETKILKQMLREVKKLVKTFTSHENLMYDLNSMK